MSCVATRRTSGRCISWRAPPSPHPPPCCASCLSRIAHLVCSLGLLHLELATVCSFRLPLLRTTLLSHSANAVQLPSTNFGWQGWCSWAARAATASSWSCRSAPCRPGWTSWLCTSAPSAVRPSWTAWRPSRTCWCSRTRQVCASVAAHPIRQPNYNTAISRHGRGDMQPDDCSASALVTTCAVPPAALRAGSGESRLLLCCGCAPTGSVRIARLAVGLQPTAIDDVTIMVLHTCAPPITLCETCWCLALTCICP